MIHLADHVFFIAQPDRVDRQRAERRRAAQGVDQTGVGQLMEIAVKKGMKPKQGEPIKLPFDKIRSGKVEIEFSHLEEAGLEKVNNGPSEEA